MALIIPCETLGLLGVNYVALQPINSSIIVKTICRTHAKSVAALYHGAPIKQFRITMLIANTLT